MIKTEIAEHDPSLGGLIFVLDSRTPVGWRIAFLGDTSYMSEKKIILSEGSSIISNNQKSVTTVEFMRQVSNYHLLTIYIEVDSE
jgi:hypothetical protein